MGTCRSCSHKSPGLAAKALNLAGAATRIGGNILSGRRIMVPEEVFKSRADICRGCEWFNKTNETCGVCGCFVTAIFGKAKFASEECPRGKWKTWEY